MRAGVAALIGVHDEVFAVALDPGHQHVFTDRAVIGGLFVHPSEQVGARDTLGIAGVIVRARDQRSAARPTVEQADRQVKPREIDRGGQSRRASADDDAIVHAPQDAADVGSFLMRYEDGKFGIASVTHGALSAVAHGGRDARYMD